MTSLPCTVIFFCRFFLFSTLNISSHSLVACRVVYGVPLVCYFSLAASCCFSLAAFNILSLCVVFVSLVSMCLGVFLLGFILYGTLYASWTWQTISFSMLGKFSTIVSSEMFSYPLLFLVFFWDPYNLNFGAFDLVTEVSETILSSFPSFYTILLFGSYFHHFIFRLTDLLFSFRYSAIDSF